MTVEHLLWGLAIFIISYAIGSISFSRMVLRLLSKEPNSDVVRIKREGEEENAQNKLPLGANTVGVKHGTAPGCTVAILDMMKGALPTLAAMLLFPGQPYYLVAAVGALVGHNWPVYHQFIGGQGMSVIIGAMLVIDWLSIPVTALAGMVIGLFLLRNFMVIFYIMVIGLIPWLWFRFMDLPHLIFGVAVLVVFIFAMISPMRYYMKQKKEGTAMSMDQIMESLPMGRGMNRILEFLHLKPRVPK